MTKIIYDREGLCLSMEGHALSGNYGEDIVCAAESMLLMCLEKRLLDYGEQVCLSTGRSPGRVRIEARPEAEAETLCRESFDTVFAGFLLLAEYEPEHVSATQIGEEDAA